MKISITYQPPPPELNIAMAIVSAPTVASVAILNKAVVVGTIAVTTEGTFIYTVAMSTDLHDCKYHNKEAVPTLAEAQRGLLELLAILFDTHPAELIADVEEANNG